MANCSDAVVSMTAEKCFSELMDYIRDNEKTEYPLLIPYWTSGKDDNDSGTVSGDSVGRWSYDANLDGYFGEKLDAEWARPEYYDKETDQLKKGDYSKSWLALRNKLEDDASIEIDVKDFEPGWKILYESKYVVDKAGLRVVERYDYEMNEENLVKLGFADSYEYAKELLGIDEETE